MSRSTRPGRVLLATLAIALGCSSSPVQQAGIPGTAAGASVELLAERGPNHLDVVVATGGTSWRFFLPASEACRAILEASELRYAQSGPLGSLRSGDELRCDPNGILSLRQWRDRTSRSRPPGIPSGQARYRIIYRDDDLALALGRFPMVGHLGWTGGEHTIAVIPNSQECQEQLARNVSTIEYRASGAVPLALLGSSGRCPLLGLARPD
jgi:hypothetical protein